MMTPVERESAQLAEVVAALARATGRTLDPTILLERAMAVLDTVVASDHATLWVDRGRGVQQVAARSVGDGASRAAAESSPADTASLTIVLEGIDRPLGRLVVTPPAGRTFSSDDRAILEIAGGQIAGALERARLFEDVMELERLKSDFIARVSHELRTPITIINGFVDTLLTHADDLSDEQRRHMLHRSKLASSRLARLIEELLILSRIDAGVLTPEHGPVDIAALLAEVREAAIEPDQVLLAVPSGATCTSDPDLLGRALGLLVDNAIKYGGIAEVRAAMDDGEWVFEVRDHGAGFPEDVRATAFEMFTRSGDTTTIPGLGVGLPIARTLVEVLDGRITLGSAPEGGGLVRIALRRE